MLFRVYENTIASDTVIECQFKSPGSKKGKKNPPQKVSMGRKDRKNGRLSEDDACRIRERNKIRTASSEAEERVYRERLVEHRKRC